MPLERMLGPYLCASTLCSWGAPNRFICTSTEIRDGISTLLRMGRAFATQLTGYQPIGLEEAIEHVFR